jgi:hypothetical protein
MFRWITAVFLVMCVFWSNFSTADEVTLRFPRPGKDNKEKKSEVSKIKGRLDLEKSNASKIILTVGKEEEAIEVTNIEGIAYDREPDQFATIRTAIANGSYNEAATEVQRLAAAIEAGNVPPISGDAAKKDFEYWMAYLPAMQALEGSAKVDPAAAAKKLLAFLTANPTHYRFYEGNETLGQLAFLVPGDPVAASTQYFGRLATNTELKELQFRGKLLMARALLKANNVPRAGQLLTPMVAEKAENRMMASQIAQAKIALAQATAAAGNTDNALKMLQAVIEETPSNDYEAHARANIALGNIHLSKQSKTEALLAFLKVDLLFFQYPEQRAEALARLAKLWNEIPAPKADRANEARERLESLYPYTTVK